MICVDYALAKMTFNEANRAVTELVQFSDNPEEHHVKLKKALDSGLIKDIKEVVEEGNE